MGPMPLHDALAALVLVALSVASARLYARDHAARDYASGERQPMPSPRSFEHVYTFIRISTLVAGLGALLSDHPVWLVVAERSGAQTGFGTAVALAGFGLFVGAKRELGRNYSPCFDSYVPSAIVQTGVYARIRHPIYTANLATLVGIAVATGSLWIALNAVVLAAYYTRSARAEEAALTAAHPDYAGYVSRTGRFLPSREGRGRDVEAVRSSRLPNSSA